MQWGDQAIKNYWVFLYLGSAFRPDGQRSTDINHRIVRAQTRAGQLHHIWASDILSLDLKLRLYSSAVCSILTYGVEAWFLDEATCKRLNGANARMLVWITGLSIREESDPATCTFNIILWIRARRLKWVGHIMRLKDEDERLIKQALRHIHSTKQAGDILMDTADASWQELQDWVNDKET